MRREVKAAEHAARQGDFDQKLSNAFGRNKKRHGANELEIASADDFVMREEPESAKHNDRHKQADPYESGLTKRPCVRATAATATTSPFGMRLSFRSVPAPTASRIKLVSQAIKWMGRRKLHVLSRAAPLRPPTTSADRSGDLTCADRAPKYAIYGRVDALSHIQITTA